MPTCQNGWPADPNRTTLVALTVGGASFPGGVRGGDVAVVLRYVAEQFHARVESLYPGWCWGYAYREVTGGGALSNHAGGYALDFNAPNHGLGASGTFSSAQVAAIRAILAEVSGVVRWGGDYTGRKDEMHVEIVGSTAAVAAVAARLQGTTVPSTPSTGATPATLQQGDIGAAVAKLQAWFNATYPAYSKIDLGPQRFGPQTVAVVREFQRRSGLVADGVIGPRTWSALVAAGYRP